MRVLFAFNEDLNPYVEVLLYGLECAGLSVEKGTGLFWQKDLFNHDIIHIQWPETLFDWRTPSEIELEFLKQRLLEVKRTSKIIFTIHNVESHHITDDNRHRLHELYSLVAEYSDVMVHLGAESCRSWKNASKYPEKRHEIIPIPVYDYLYNDFLAISSEEAKRCLRLPVNKKIVLTFGNFRYEQERKLVQDAFSSLKGTDCILVAPKWYKPWDYCVKFRHPMLSLRTVKKAFWAYARRMKLESKRTMTHNEVALYFAAADVVMIQRLHDLNSGNLPMAFLFRKVVVGPDRGNIGCWCRLTGNPVFDPDSKESVIEALQNGLALSSTDLGNRNYNFAINRWSTKVIGEKHKSLYESII